MARPFRFSGQRRSYALCPERYSQVKEFYRRRSLIGSVIHCSNEVCSGPDRRALLFLSILAQANCCSLACCVAGSSSVVHCSLLGELSGATLAHAFSSVSCRLPGILCLCLRLLALKACKVAVISLLRPLGPGLSTLLAVGLHHWCLSSWRRELSLPRKIVPAEAVSARLWLFLGCLAVCPISSGSPR